MTFKEGSNLLADVPTRFELAVHMKFIYVNFRKCDSIPNKAEFISFIDINKV